jgi:hypothetical protein
MYDHDNMVEGGSQEDQEENQVKTRSKTQS